MQQPTLPPTTGTSGTLDTSIMFSGSGRYPAKLGFNIARTAGSTATIAADIQVGADDGGTQRWVTLSSVTAAGDGEVTYFPKWSIVSSSAPSARATRFVARSSCRELRYGR